MTIASSPSELIGNTPLFKCPTCDANAPLYLKLEKGNPSQSMKDRMALSMIQKAEESGSLLPGGTIIESSSGNTAAALAMLAVSKGYRFIAVVDRQITDEKRMMLRAYGAELVFVDGGSEDQSAAQTRRDAAKELSRQIPNSYYTNQADNDDNPAGYASLAQEIVDGMKDVCVLIGAIGTGGSLCGTGRALRLHIPDVHIVAVEPMGSTVFSEDGGKFFQTGTGRTPGTIAPANTDYGIIGEHCSVSDREAFNAARFFARKIGLLLGGSAGGVAYKALERIHAKKTPSGSTVAIMPDGGERYLNSIFNDEWMAKHALLDKSIEIRMQIYMGLSLKDA